MTFHDLILEADSVHLDCVAAEVATLELELRATSCDERAEAALRRLLARCGM